MLEAMASTFSDLLCGRAVHPKAWKQSMLSIIFKDGVPYWPKSYRPICMIPVMAKLYSMIPLARIQDAIESAHVDGNRKNRVCCDAVHVSTSKRHSTACTT